MREKLIELLMQLEDNLCDDCGREPVGCAVVAIADHLIANGVRLETKQATSDKTSDESKRTNADRIRAMTDEELAALLAHETYRIAEPCFQYIGLGITEEVVFCQRLKWLKQPVGVE